MNSTATKPAIVIVRGGTNSRLRERSLQSGSAVYHTLRDDYDVRDIHLTLRGNYELNGKQINIVNYLSAFDGIVFHTLEGKDAVTFQNVCRKIKVTSTGNFHTRYAEAGQMERKNILRKSGVKTIPYWRLDHNFNKADSNLYESILRNLRYPVVISPLPDVFSVNALVVRSESELRDVLDTCFTLDSPVTVSDTYQGNLYATIVMASFRNESPYVFPTYEILHDHDISNAYDQDNSTHQSNTSQSSPADVIALSKSAFQKLHLRDIARIDILETPDKEIYVLDVNPHPELGRHSLISDAVGQVGGTMNEVLSSITKQTVKRHQQSMDKKVRSKESVI
jgi:D-alanine-D-alanine ligase-like ATP-grasp enzyme